MKHTKILPKFLLLLCAVIIGCFTVEAKNRTYCLSQGESYNYFNDRVYDSAGVFFYGKQNPQEKGGEGILWVYGYIFSGDFSNCTSNSIDVKNVSILNSRQVTLVKSASRMTGAFSYKLKPHGFSSPVVFEHATIMWDKSMKVYIKNNNDYFFLNPSYDQPQAKVQLSDGAYITATNQIRPEDGRTDSYTIEYRNGDKFIGLPANLREDTYKLPTQYRESIDFMLALKKYKGTDFTPWTGYMRYASGSTDNFKKGESINEKERIRQEEYARAEREAVNAYREAEEARLKQQEQERINREKEAQARHNKLVKKYGASVAKEIEAGKVRVGTSEVVLIENNWRLISESSSRRIYADYGRFVGTQYYPDLISTRVVCQNGKVVQIDQY